MFDVTRSPAAAVFDASNVDEVLDALLVERPGPWMCGVLTEIADWIRTPLQRETYLRCWDRFLPWAQLQRSDAVGAAAESQESVDGPFGRDDFGADAVALITGQTRTTATTDVINARLLARDLNGCYSALERGEISWQMAREVAEAAAQLTDWGREQVDQAMVNSWQIDTDITAWRRRLRREVLKARENPEAERKKAVAARNVRIWPLPDGMAAVNATIRAEDAAKVNSALNALADRYAAQDRVAAKAAAASRQGTDTGDDTGGNTDVEWISPDDFADLPTEPPGLRTWDQRRADAFVDVFDDMLGDPDLPKRHGRRPVVQATGGIKTLLGLRNDPGYLTGYGPISADHLREIAADADWQRFCLADDTGALIAIGRDTYRPNQALQDFLLAAHPCCDYPGCPLPSHRSDCDHSIDFDDGGPTDEHNCRPRCRRHHRCRTHAGWTVKILPDQSVAWTTPAGTTRIIAPDRLAGDDSDDEPDSDT